MQNKFPKICFRCKTNVPAMTGFCHRIENEWKVYHKVCWKVERPKTPDISEDDVNALLSNASKQNDSDIDYRDQDFLINFGMDEHYY